MKNLALLILLISVSGCSRYRAYVGQYGQETSDAALHDALWTICKAVPVGAIKRRFDTLERLIQYNAMCREMEQVPIYEEL